MADQFLKMQDAKHITSAKYYYFPCSVSFFPLNIQFK